MNFASVLVQEPCEEPDTARRRKAASVEGSNEAGEGTIDVVLVEDHLAIRRGVELLLAGEGIRVAGVADTVESGLAAVELAAPDVAVVDLTLGDGTGIELTRRILAGHPQTRVMLYTGTDDPGLLSEALNCGARGFVLKTAPSEELVRAIREVAQGLTYMDQRLASGLLERSTTAAIPELSPREREMLDLLAAGLTGAEIARRLYLSPETVRTHVRNAMVKLRAHTRIHAVALALKQKAIPLSPAEEPPADGSLPTAEGL